MKVFKYLRTEIFILVDMRRELLKDTGNTTGKMAPITEGSSFLACVMEEEYGRW